MATSTTNLALIKPAGTDKIRIAQINSNMDVLDTKIGPVGQTSLQVQLNGKIGASGGVLTGNLIFSNSGNAAGSVQFNNSSGILIGGLFQFTDSGRLCLAQTTPSASTAYGNGERYLMPVPSDHDTVTYYNVLTTKNAVTVPQGGTGANNAKTARENLGLKTESIALTFTSGVAHQTGTSGIVCGHLIHINECVKLSADKAAGATWFSIPYTNAKWAYGTVQDASGFVATCHLVNGNVIVDQTVKASEHQYPQIIITSRIDD